MKRTLLVILTLCLLLTGCAGSGKDKDTGKDTKTASILDDREAFDDSGVLWYIPNAQLEAQQAPTVRSFAGDLLMTVCDYISDGNSELTLTLLSAANGEELKSCKLNLTESAEVQVFDDNIIVCDSSAGKIIVLDKQLREVERHEQTPDGETWLLGADLDTLYKFSYLNGFRSVSLSKRSGLMSLELSELSVCSVIGNNVCFAGFDSQTLGTSAYCLDLSSGKLSEPPIYGSVSRLYHSGDVWLAGFEGQSSVFAFSDGSDTRSVTSQGGAFSLVEPSGRILFTGENGELSLYDASGKFISTCDLSGCYVQGLVWREELNGYLMPVTDSEGKTKLLFWDTAAKVSGKDLQTQPFSGGSTGPGADPSGTSADASLYERAQKLSDRYGVDIRIADRCETEFAYFSCYQVSDYSSVSEGLDILEKALSVFPNGFFRQLAYSSIDGTQFQLVGGLSATNGFGGDTSYAAFTDTKDGVCRIVADIYSLNKNAIWHELAHAVDKRLIWDAAHRDDALFSEGRWNSFNPDGFDYFGEYGSQHSVHSDWYAYFVDDYAMTNAGEDRARIFENAIENSGTLFRNAGLIAKLNYYCACIRDCFDTAQWPSTTAWEAPLS